MAKKALALLLVVIGFTATQWILPPEYSIANISSSKLKKCPKGTEYPDMSFAVMNKGLGIPMDYVPEDLVIVPRNITKYSALCFKKSTAEALTSLLEESKKDKIMLAVTSGYRDATEQARLFNYWFFVDPRRAINEVALPGASEHQLGVAVDFTGASINFKGANEKFENSLESKWLEENAYKFGFVMSYPKGKEVVTGYSYEPWHYRYVGLEVAEQVKFKGSTYKEVMEERNNPERIL